MTNPIRTEECPEYYFRERCFIRELLNHPGEAGLSIAQARVEPGITTVWHALAGTEVYYILSGRGRAEVAERSYAVAAGDLIYIRAGEAQRITNQGSTDLLFLAICSPRFTPENYTELETGNSNE